MTISNIISRVRLCAYCKNLYANAYESDNYRTAKIVSHTHRMAQTVIDEFIIYERVKKKKTKQIMNKDTEITCIVSM